MREILKRQFYNSGYTRYNFVVLLICILSQFQLQHLYAIITCTSWGICISFHTAMLLDNTCFIRMAYKENISMKEFYCYNFCLHVCPCLITIIIPPNFIYLWHGIISAYMHLVWTLLISNYTLCLDDIYCHMPMINWYILNLSAYFIELMTPLIFCYMNDSYI